MKQVKRRVAAIFMLCAMLITTVLSSNGIASVKADTPGGPQALTIDQLTDGKDVVIYNEANKKVISDAESNHNLGGITASVKNGKLMSMTDATVFTVHKDAEGFFTFVDKTTGNTALSAFKSGTYVNLGVRAESDTADDCSKWTLEAVDADTFKIKNSKSVDKNSNANYIGFNKGIFQPYTNPGTKTLAYFEFYDASDVVTGNPNEEYENLLMTDELKTGDKVAIYGGGETSIISNTVASHNLGVIGLTVENGKMKSDSTAAIFEVTKDADGKFSFKDKKTNKYLAVTNDNYRNLIVSDTLDDTAKWELAKVGSTKFYTIKNVGVKNGSDDQYIEYSGSEYKVYKKSDSEIFNFGFIKESSFNPSSLEAEPNNAVAPVADNAEGVLICSGNAIGSSNVTGQTAKINAAVVKEMAGKPVVTKDQVALFKATRVTGADSVVRYKLFDQTSGKYLSIKKNGTKTDFTYTDTAADDYSLWEMEESDAANGLYNIRNAKLYADGVNSYVEYYQGAFSIYKAPKTADAIYQFKFVNKNDVTLSEEDVNNISTKCAAVTGSPNGGAVAEGTELTLSTKTPGAVIKYAVVASEDATPASWETYTSPIKLNTLPVIIKAKATADGLDESAVKTFSFKKKTGVYNTYFGQIHSHTEYSDGQGDPETAFKHASREVANLDFLAVTDHSNSLDNADVSDLLRNVDTSPEQEWTKGHALAKKYTTDDFTCFYGFEMTWSNGLGHINTFNTEGFQSRTQAEYKNYGTALVNYYNKLAEDPNSISQFNHPGTTFGDFQDFAYFTEERDNLITMIEVGNGEGAIGSSGYFPSYEYYQRALDKGWHVAPTNNQDNHKAYWGDANTARTVMVSDENSENAIYDSMRNYRIYATEDNNLSIKYTLNGNIMGSILTKEQVGDTANIKAVINDPDANDVIGKVQVIVNGGIVAASKEVSGNSSTVEFSIPNDYSFYYIKVVEKDGDIAVTAPVWSGKVEACGINKTYTDTVLAVAGEKADVNVEFYNNEKSPLTINGITISTQGQDLYKASAAEIASAGVNEIAAKSTGLFTWKYTPDKAGKVKLDVKVDATFNGVKKVYSDVLYITYTDKKLVSDVIVDGTHFNDYVTGYYGGNMGNFTKLAGSKNVRVTVDRDGITSDELKNCKLLVISAPAKKSGTANAGDYTVSHFEDSFLNTVKDYVSKGGSVIVCGLADYQDTPDCQGATELNKLLAAIGSTMKINSDEVWDDEHNGGQQYRLYPNKFNTTSKYTQGLVAKQVYSQYSGCSVNISNAKANNVVEAAEWLVQGYDTTGSKDCKDDQGNTIAEQPWYIRPGEGVTFLAHQATKAGGHIFAAGGVFVSDFEIKAEMDNNDDLPYANLQIATNILSEYEKQVPVSTIAEARKGSVGDIFAVEGYVTSGTTNPNTTFFDTIYIQDETGGIDVFPYAESGMEVGTKLRVIGTWDQYQGDTELRVISVKKLDGKKVYAPREVSTKDAMDYAANGGSYLKTTGTVTRVKLTDSNEVEEFWIKDSTGVEAAIFIDGYIKSGTTGKNTLADFVKVGEKITAAGILYMHPEGDSDVSVPVFRVKDCDEIVKAKAGKIVIQVAPDGTVSKDQFMSALLNGQDIEVISADGKAIFEFANSKLNKAVIDGMTAFNPEVVFGKMSKAVTKRLKGLSKSIKTYGLHFEYDGDLPGEAEVTLDVSEAGFREGRTLYLYYYNPSSNGFQLIDTGVLTGGKVTFTMTHCSDYVITDKKLPSKYLAKAPKTDLAGDKSASSAAVFVAFLALMGTAYTVSRFTGKREEIEG